MIFLTFSLCCPLFPFNLLLLLSWKNDLISIYLKTEVAINFLLPYVFIYHPIEILLINFGRNCYWTCTMCQTACYMMWLNENLQSLYNNILIFLNIFIFFCSLRMILGFLRSVFQGKKIFLIFNKILKKII